MLKDKILALLVAKFAGVRKDGLAQMASVLSLQVEKEDEATALVEKLTAEKVNDFVKDWRKDVDKEVSDATKTHEGNLKKKFDFVEKKEPVDPSKKTDPTPADPTDIAAIVANAIKAAVEPLQQKLSAFEGQKTTEARLQHVQGKLVNVPDSYKNQQIEYNKLIIGSMTDEQFAEHLKKVESDVTAFNQELADKGLAGQGKPVFGQKTAEGVSAGVKGYLDSKSDKSADNLKGKELNPKSN